MFPRVPAIGCLALLTLILAAPWMLQADDAKIKAAEEAGKAWLALLDGGKWPESWDRASRLFQEKISKDDWVRMAGAARDPLGKLVSRRVNNSDYVTELPGMPDGEYVVIEYESSFQKKRSAAEALTMTLDSDGKWKSCGYFVR